MAEASMATNKLFTKSADLLRVAFTPTCYIGLDTANMDGYTASNHPAVLTNAAGLTPKVVDTPTLITTTVTNDTLKLTTTFTAGASAAINGSVLISAVASYDVFAWHRWAGVVNIAANDTLTQTFNVQYKAG